MLKTTHIFKKSSVESLISLWQQRYTLDLSYLSSEYSEYYSLLARAASQDCRALTVAKLKNNVLELNCKTAWTQTRKLYNYIPNILDLNEASRITQFTFRIYRKLLEVYQQESFKQVLSTTELLTNRGFSSWQIPAIDHLAYTLEPILIVFQEQHLASGDWRAVGFMTTQLNFCNELILKKLDPFEKVLLSPYLKFVEEQVAIPWQRVCAAAVKYELSAPEIILVEQMLPAAPEVASAVYQKLVELLPNHRSRRGELRDAPVTHSCIRDLNMFQAYLWLCFLEKTLEPLEHELLPLCEMVLESMDIKLEMTRHWCHILALELENRVKPQQQDLLKPYTQAIKDLFL